MKYREPLGDRVLVKPKEAETRTPGGLIIPDTAREKPQQGTVVKVGAGHNEKEYIIKEGDTVIYSKYAGTEVTLEGVDYLLMKRSDCLMREWEQE